MKNYQKCNVNWKRSTFQKNLFLLFKKNENKYKSLSRVLTFIKNNINLFIVTTNTISINPTFEHYFYNNFIKKYDFEDLHEQLLRDVDYSYFLHNTQKFNINLIDEPTGEMIPNEPEKITVSSYIDEQEGENDYLDKVDSIDERNINDDVGKDAYKVEPVAVTKFGKKRRFSLCNRLF